jgi:hypothetical protein
MRPIIICLAFLIQACAVELDVTGATTDTAPVNEPSTFAVEDANVPPPAFTVDVSCFMADGSLQVQAVLTTYETYFAVQPECLAAGGELLIEINPSTGHSPVGDTTGAAVNTINARVFCELTGKLSNTWLGQGQVDAPGAELTLSHQCIDDGGPLVVAVNLPPVFVEVQ